MMDQNTLLSLLWQFFLAGTATVCFGLTFGVPRREYWACGLVGAVGWAVYTLMLWNGHGSALATLVASIPLAALARAFAIWHKAPVTLFLVSGIFPLVPGAGIYYTAYYFIMGDPRFGGKGMETLRVALALALGMTIVLGLPLPLHYQTRQNGTGKPVRPKEKT